MSRTVAAELPDVQISMTEVPTPRQPEALLAAQIDIGVCHAFTSVTPYLRNLHRQPLLDDPANCALVAPDHPLAAQVEITLEDLANLPFLFMPRSLYPAFYDRVMTFFADRGFQPRIDQAFDGLQTTWSLARRGEGWCIGFATNLRYPPAGLAAVPVRGLEIPLGIEMLYRRDETRGAVLGVVEVIRRAAEVASSDRRADVPQARVRR
jgi:DNA-binding transcriptional LysR family regulator